MLDELVLAHQPPGALQQHFEQGEFARREFHHMTVERDHAASDVVVQRAVLDDGAGAAHAPARQGSHPGFELLQREGLGHVVVGAEVEAAHLVFHTVGRGENEHRHGGAACAQLAQHLEARQPRQPQVENQQIEFAGLQRGVGAVAVGHLIDRITQSAQRAQQAVGQDPVIFGNQNAHACLHDVPNALPLRPDVSGGF